MVNLLLENVPAFEGIWIEGLGDLACYWMAIEDSDIDCKIWADVARNWYHQAADENLNVGRIQHHLPVLAQPDMLQQLFHYTKSLVSVRPFPSAGESILLLFDLLLNGSGSYGQPVTAFVAAHGYLFKQCPLSDLKAPVQEYLSHLKEYINQLGAVFKNKGAYMALCNFAAIFQYGSLGLSDPGAYAPSVDGKPEVATMTYLQSKVSLPISKVLYWNDNPSNPIGTEYIIQEHVAGVQLHQMWPKMNSEQHMLCTKVLSLAMKNLASLGFPAYGSLYFSDGPLKSHMKIPFEQGFCVVHIAVQFSGTGIRGELELYGGPSPSCGPWKDPTSYCLGLIETGFSCLPKENAVNHELLPHQGSIQDHIHLLKISQEVMQKLVKDKRIQDAATPALLHPDFHKRNIYVSAKEPTVSTGLLDWQSTSIEPAFIYANETPDFAAFPDGPEENMFENRQDENKVPGHKEQERRDASICYQTYDVCMKGLAPKLRPARLLDPTLFRLFQYCHMTWRDSATAIRQELIELSARWTELELQGTCPFSPTEEELKEQAQDYEDFKIVQNLKLWLRNSLNTNSDGWVLNDVWDAAKDAHHAAYDEWIQTARESESCGESLTVAKADKLWPI